MQNDPNKPHKPYWALRRLLFRWHYRLGLVAVPLVVLLAVTGMLLNHNASLKLHKAPLGAWLAGWYGEEGGQMTWDHLLLDLHTGRFFGAYGPYAMDAAAILLLLLAASGVYNWLKRVRKW